MNVSEVRTQRIHFAWSPVSRVQALIPSITLHLSDMLTFLFLIYLHCTEKTSPNINKNYFLHLHNACILKLQHVWFQRSGFIEMPREI